MVEHKHAVIDFWTPSRVKDAKPLHKTIDDFEFPLLNLEQDQEFNNPNNDTVNDENLQPLVSNDPWNLSGDVLEAVGRLMFKSGGNTYRCSAVAVTDGDLNNGRSLILTAAHCVYDDNRKIVSVHLTFQSNKYMICCCFIVCTQVKTQPFCSFSLHPILNFRLSIVSYRIHFHSQPRRQGY